MLILEEFEIEGMSLKVVRDDLYPGIGGGNKCRKAEEYEKDMERLGCDALVTTGGVQSNHCRAMALLAAKRGWCCHLVYHGTRERFDRERGNALLVRLSGASMEFVEAERIGPAMDLAMERFRSEGHRPYYVTGGGHDLPGGIAYVTAMAEWKKDCGLRPVCGEFRLHVERNGESGLLGILLINWPVIMKWRLMRNERLSCRMIICREVMSVFFLRRKIYWNEWPKNPD